MFKLLRKKTVSPHFFKLREISLFADLTHRELGIIQELLHEREYVKDEIVFDEGEEGQAIYFLFTGKVLICRQGRPVDGAIAELPNGQFFGELALLDNSPRSAQVRAAEDCTIGVLFREDFLTLLQTHATVASKISLQLSRHIGKRLREAIHRYVL
ncbi:MAG: cyclic nucleotide-binding domain-containing protein [Methylophilaceae bacterium]